MEEKVGFCSSVLHLVVMHHLFTRLFEVEEVDWNQFKAHHTGWPLRLLKGNHILTEQMSGTLCNLIPCGWISHPYSALTFSGASHYTSELNFQYWNFQVLCPIPNTHAHKLLELWPRLFAAVNPNNKSTVIWLVIPIPYSLDLQWRIIWIVSPGMLLHKI